MDFESYEDFPRKKISSESDPIKPLVRELLRQVGEDSHREGLLETPRRFADAIRYLTSGYEKKVDEIVGNALFEADSSEMVIVKDIELYSLCEHHLLPFVGRAHVAYIPNRKIIGLSKIARIVEVFARRLQVQERMTTQIADTLMEVIQPAGVAVIIDAAHFCMMMRGVSKQNSRTVTSSMLGVFRDNPATRKELLHLLGR